ncbi:MAG: hypothetical protein ACRDGF_05100 [Chloroflexota bacterium]
MKRGARLGTIRRLRAAAGLFGLALALFVTVGPAPALPLFGSAAEAAGASWQLFAREVM